ncbi:FkbM family methyltransferase [Lachnospiraceae bacterium 62-26]
MTGKDNIRKEDIGKIYRAISDEVSKEIFCSRFLYSMTEDVSRIEWMAEEFQRSSESDSRWIALKDRILDLEGKAWIFGAGAYGKALYEKTGGAEFWKGFLDNCSETDTCMGSPVIRPKTFVENYLGEKVVLPSKSLLFEMRKQLLDMGLSEESIIDGTAWYDATEGRQYFDLQYLTYGENEVFVDGGSCDGMSSARFIEQCGKKYKKIYCFEPDKRNIERIEHNFRSRNIGNYEIIDKGLWDKEQELSFVANGTADSHIAESEEINAEKVKVVSLDKILCGESVSFIKMDIEGAEKNALKGARSTIIKYKPKLAVCVYHKPEDIWELPLLILDMREDYKLYFRHYSLGSTETVLYAL